ncbi:MAG: NAD(P)-dependent oxidoreductase, partial [Eubacterium sp.]
MKILLTGATGFLGSHLLKKFVSEKYNVVILKRSTSNVYRIENELKEVKSYDVDRVELSQVFEENEKFDAIVHTATCYGRQHESILQMEKTNLIFPLKLLENAVQLLKTDGRLVYS